jgi:hypothetical protein
MCAAGMALLAGVTWASTLRPSAIVYGQVRDAYGVRLQSGADVSCFLGTGEVARTVVGPNPAGLNYKLSLDVHDPVAAIPGEVKPGDTIQIRVKMANVYQPLIGNSTFPAPGDGSAHRADFILGTDADGDGLPDAWEQMVIANSGGVVTNLAGVGPGKDLDGDGMTDDQEFWYGSFAFLPGDALEFDRMKKLKDRSSFSFLTVLGASYVVESSPVLKPPVWTQASIALSELDAPAPIEFQGTGDYITFYIAPSGSGTVYRLRAR